MSTDLQANSAINQIMMGYGFFIFFMRTTPYQSLQHSRGSEYATSKRLMNSPAYQFIGLKEESITLSGTLVPGITGSDDALLLLRKMALEKKSWPLIEGFGYYYGDFLIEDLSITKKDFFSGGQARQLDFTLTLKRVDEPTQNGFNSLYHKIKTFIT